MKTVNLLPEWYLNRHQQRQRLHLQLCGLVFVGILFAGLAWMGRHQIVILEAKRDALDRQTAAYHNLSEDLQRQHQELHRLENLQLTYRELGSTVPMSAVVQQVLNNMTPGMALSHISIDVHGDPFKTDGRIATDPHHPARFHDVAHINIIGIAPDSMLIAQLIGKLSTNPLFNDVSLNYSRSELLHDYDIRRFDILLNMDLDRVSGTEPRSTLQASSGDFTHAG